jgi:hypothetical protein
MCESKANTLNSKHAACNLQALTLATVNWKSQRIKNSSILSCHIKEKRKAVNQLVQEETATI